MIVFIAGMQRSGSTFSFNIARELLGRRGTTYCESTGVIASAVANSGSASNLLFKGHAADESTLRLAELDAIRCICTVRKPEDAIASLMTTFSFGLDESIDFVIAWIRMYRRLRPHAVTIQFEDIERDPVSAAVRCAHHLLPNAPVDEIREIALRYSKANVLQLASAVETNEDAVDIGFSRYDPLTFFHRRHVSGILSFDAVDRLRPAAINAIRTRLSAYVDEAGNLHEADSDRRSS